MCGIFGAVSHAPVCNDLLNGLKRLEYRGYDSAGMMVHSPGKPKPATLKSVGNTDALKTAYRSVLSSTGNEADIFASGTTGIAHTRWATHGKPTERNAHPHRAGFMHIVHNGIIENHAPLRQSLRDGGYEFQSDTDTEVMAALLHRISEENPDFSAAETVREMAPLLHGAYGLVVFDERTPDCITVVRSGSPMVIGLSSNANYVASDTTALTPLVERVIHLDEGDMAVVKKNGVDIYNSSGERTEKTIQYVERDHDVDGKGGYDSYMAKEIAEQPDVIAGLLKKHLNPDNMEVLPNSSLTTIAPALAGCDHIHIIACGTSYHAGLVAKDYFERYLGIATQVEIASEYRYRHVVVPHNSAFICISQSGETADTLAALRKARNSNYHFTLTLCNVETSSMVREASYALLLEAGAEIGVASTKAFTTQLTAFLMLTMTAAKDERTKKQIFRALKTLPKDCQDMLLMAENISQEATNVVASHSSCLYLGRGQHAAIALEGALKLKELAYIHAEAYASGELKHGPLALVDDDLPIVISLPNDAVAEKAMANLEEVAARGGRFVIFADADVTFPEPDNAVVLRLPRVPLMTSAITHVIPLQLLSYYVTLKLGNNVDQPRSLAKSVSVE